MQPLDRGDVDAEDPPGRGQLLDPAQVGRQAREICGVGEGRGRGRRFDRAPDEQAAQEDGQGDPGAIGAVDDASLLGRRDPDMQGAGQDLIGPQPGAATSLTIQHLATPPIEPQGD